MILVFFIACICFLVNASLASSSLSTKNIFRYISYGGKNLLGQSLSEYRVKNSRYIRLFLKKDYLPRTSCKVYVSRIPKNIGQNHDTCILAFCKGFDCNKYLTFIMTKECLSSHALEFENEKNFLHIQCTVDNDVLPMYSVEVKAPLLHNSTPQNATDEASLNAYKAKIDEAVLQNGILSHAETIEKHKDLSRINPSSLGLNFISTPLNVEIKKENNTAEIELAKWLHHFGLRQPTLKNGFDFWGEFQSFTDGNEDRKIALNFEKLNIASNKIDNRYRYCSQDQFCLNVRGGYFFPLENDLYAASLPFVFYVGPNNENMNTLSFVLKKPLKTTPVSKCIISASYLKNNRQVLFDLAYCSNTACHSSMDVYFGEGRVPGLNTWKDIYAVTNYKLHVKCVLGESNVQPPEVTTIPFKLLPGTKNVAKETLPLLSQEKLREKPLEFTGRHFATGMSHFVATENDQTVEPYKIKFGRKQRWDFSDNELLKDASEDYQTVYLDNHEIFFGMNQVKIKFNETVINLASNSNSLMNKATFKITNITAPFITEVTPSVPNDITDCKMDIYSRNEKEPIDQAEKTVLDCKNGCKGTFETFLPQKIQKCLNDTATCMVSYTARIQCNRKFFKNKPYIIKNVAVYFEVDPTAKAIAAPGVNVPAVVKNLSRSKRTLETKEVEPKEQIERVSPQIPAPISVESRLLVANSNAVSKTSNEPAQPSTEDSNHVEKVEITYREETLPSQNAGSSYNDAPSTTNSQATVETNNAIKANGGSFKGNIQAPQPLAEVITASAFTRDVRENNEKDKSNGSRARILSGAVVISFVYFLVMQ